MSGIGEARDFELGVWIERQDFKSKSAKLGRSRRRLRYVTPTNNKCKGRSKGAWPTPHVLLLLNLLPFYISEMGKARDFKFGVLIERRDFKPKNAKVGQ